MNKKIDENSLPGSSFVMTETTAPIFESLVKAKWNVKEIVNAGILMFAQSEESKQRLFASIATRIIDIEANENARSITRNHIRDWEQEIQRIASVAKAVQARASKKKRPPASIKSEVG